MQTPGAHFALAIIQLSGYLNTPQHPFAELLTISILAPVNGLRGSVMKAHQVMRGGSNSSAIRHPAPGWIASVTGFAGDGRVAMLILGCVAYLILHYASEFISVAHTQMQQNIGQRLVFDLRRRLFSHLQSLSLRYHLKRGAGETIYHIENDSYCVESLTLGGILPL